MHVPKEEKPNTQNALPTFSMIMPIAGGSSLEFETKGRGVTTSDKSKAS
jgi:hypothetical protein